nr:MAG TPA: alternate secretin pathway subunit S [Caudoviricetes sp.]
MLYNFVVTLSYSLCSDNGTKAGYKLAFYYRIRIKKN